MMTLQKWWQETLAQVERDTEDASAFLIMVREFWLGKVLGCGFIIGFSSGLFVTDIDGALGIALLTCIAIFAVYGLSIVVAWILPTPFAWINREQGTGNREQKS
jgi:hypothetical protein